MRSDGGEGQGRRGEEKTSDGKNGKEKEGEGEGRGERMRMRVENQGTEECDWTGKDITAQFNPSFTVNMFEKRVTSHEFTICCIVPYRCVIVSACRVWSIT